jgi:hypothetical protein
MEFYPAVITKRKCKSFNYLPKHGLTPGELAFKAGVGLRFLRELGRGKTTVQLDKVNIVLNMFGKELGVTDIPREIEQ